MNKPQYGEPWTCDQEELFDRNGHIVIGITLDRARACINACAGLRDEDLKAVPHVRELLEALKAVMVMSNSTKPRKLDEALTWVANDEKAFRMATEALAKAEGREGQDED